MKVLILYIIEFIDKLKQRLKLAYDETWGCEEITKEFSEEVYFRQDVNKENFIGFTAGVFTFNAAKNGIYLAEETARELAEQKFNEGVEKGYFDELYNIKGETNEQK